MSNINNKKKKLALPIEICNVGKNNVMLLHIKLKPAVDGGMSLS